MKPSNIKYLKEAKQYASALFQTAAEINAEEKIYNDIIFISETINSNEELKIFLKNPAASQDDKHDIIKRLFSLHIEPLSFDFIQLMLDNGRLNCLDAVIDCFTGFMNEKNNVMTPVITSAAEMTQEQKERLVQKLEAKTGKKIKPEYIINPDITGGIIVQAGDKIIDCSLKAKFDNMKKHLKNI